MAASGYEGHMSKRLKTDEHGFHGYGQRDKFDDPHKPPPSAVVHVRGLSDAAIEGDLVEAVQHFGGVRDVIMMPRKRQALIEFEDAMCARNCVEYSQTSPINVAGSAAFFNYSTSQKIQRPGDPEDSQQANHILLFTVLNPQYPITVDVMHTICSSYGQVLRIVIFKKNGVQTMVEFDNVDSAKRAKASLNGADVYSGCCTLKIEYAKPTRLNVVRNDTESWDYTQPNLGKEHSGGHSRGQPLLQEPRYGSQPAPYNGPADVAGGGGGGGGAAAHGGAGYGGRGGGGGGYDQGGYYDHGQNEGFDTYNGPPSGPPRGGPGGPPPARYGGPPERYGGPPGPPKHRGGYDDRGPGGYGPPPPRNFQQYDQGPQGPPSNYNGGSVVMVYGLSNKMNCDKVFNLFCLYGNVIRVKFLKSKEGSAMVQMGEPVSVERVMANLHGTVFFDNKLQLTHSKQAFLQDVRTPHELEDGTPSFKDFMGSRNNRFTNPEAAQKNRIHGPSKVLHYFNAPPGLTEEEINEMFTSKDLKKPTTVKIFPAKSERSSTGLIEFENKGEATEGLVVCNHTSLPNPVEGKGPYIFKLCFSSTPISGKE
ncbi:hypothetical protein LOTGIDRAFT_222631 [Lottia gigantea]|uniref:RRM domain-containing protein n=1 Tax=Lottia gigantea TaxID=225164 RepID=V3YZF6_LOTGI|nr:hypothetical protein LOTGIDRAFT_222631 [Lottia gigantea]ESO83568.1 hypothetical protein LOTGIDRAFT_222631 [Lottia gigantea]